MSSYLFFAVFSIDKATGEETLLAPADPSKFETLWSKNLRGFPGVNEPRALKEPVALYGSADRGSLQVGTLEGFNVTSTRRRNGRPGSVRGERRAVDESAARREQLAATAGPGCRRS
ncbi:hypothetical protein [Streptomyces sp. NPDC054849]